MRPALIVTLVFVVTAHGPSAAGQDPTLDAKRLTLVKNKLTHRGTTELTTGEPYQGKASFKVFTIRLAAGKGYQIELLCVAHSAYLFLEGPDGQIVAQHAGGADQKARIVYRAPTGGDYRIVATSHSGERTGPFTLTVQVVPGAGLMKGLPSWFEKLDTNGDGQISLFEWRQGGKSPEEFARYDLNNDGLITADEVLRVLQGEGRPRK
jgi:hypothetical protein